MCVFKVQKSENNKVTIQRLFEGFLYVVNLGF